MKFLTKSKLLIIMIVLYLTVGHNCNCNIDTEPPYEDCVEIALPYCEQDEVWYCAVACTQMWLLYAGIEVSQQDIALIAGTTLNGTSIGGVRDALDWYGVFYVDVGSYENTEDGQNRALSDGHVSLSLGEPAIYYIDDGWHAIIWWKYCYCVNEKNSPSGDIIHFNDPWDGPDVRTYDWLKDHYKPWDEPYEDGLRYYNVVDSAAISISNIAYNEFLKRCGTYYGGPDVYIPEGSTFVRIRYPNAEESFYIGTFKEIIWESNGLTGPIRLELQKDDLVIGTIAENLPIENGSFNWEVGEFLEGRAQTGDGFKIRVSMMDDSFNDTSNLEFSISQPPTLIMTSPNGGENWIIGSTYNITWNAANVTGLVRLTLLEDDAIFGPIVSDIDAEAGFYTWTLGKLTNGRTITPGSEYKIKIKLQGEDVSDISDATFNISNNSEINVISPNGGENWLIGSNRNITWTAAGVTDAVTLYLFENNSNLGSIETNLNPAAGSYTWTVGNLKNGTTVSPGSSYKIKIESQGEPCSDYSDAPFTLSDSTQIPVIWLSKESVTYTVSWSAPPFSDTFEIKNIGAGTLQYGITSRADGIGVQPDTGSSSGEIDTINLTIDPIRISPGTKDEGTILVIAVDDNASNSPQVINSTIYVKPLKVTSPNPANGATNIDLNQNLRWSAAEGAVKYNVYFGTDSPVYKTTTTNLNWTYTGTMYYNKLYKWRIDSVDSNDKITTGDEWNFTTKQTPTAISINLGDPDQNDHVYRFDFPMGYTEPVTITERDGSVRRTKTLDDPYMCFKVSDDWAYQGFLPNQNPQEPISQLAITIIYLDNGTGYLNLQYDSTEYEYKSGGTVDLQDTNIWKQHIFYVSDAYFGNRQNNGGDFRIARNLRGGLLYLDIVHISR